MYKTRFFFPFSTFIFFSCFNTSEENKKINYSNADYNLSAPASTYYLPSELNEVSGIHYLNEAQISCIQDEEGKIFIYNINTKKIDHEIPFGRKGDYEDITKMEESYFILRNDGTLFKNTSGQTVKYDTHLSKENNTESLCYDKDKQRLLIGCKDGKKEVYYFDLITSSVSSTPLFTIDIDNFLPTAIGIHPVSKKLYVLSKSKLAILNTDGKLIEILDLKKSLFSQPEGISFRENGDLFISNEGRGMKANILEFKYEPNEK
jgi:hypothetical protein